MDSHFRHHTSCRQVRQGGWHATVLVDHEPDLFWQLHKIPSMVEDQVVPELPELLRGEVVGEFRNVLQQFSGEISIAADTFRSEGAGMPCGVDGFVKPKIKRADIQTSEGV
jgi:hypothetical protein